MLMPACPSDVCMAVRASTLIHTAAVRDFHCKSSAWYRATADWILSTGFNKSLMEVS